MLAEDAPTLNNVEADAPLPKGLAYPAGDEGKPGHNVLPRKGACLNRGLVATVTAAARLHQAPTTGAVRLQ